VIPERKREKTMTKPVTGSKERKTEKMTPLIETLITNLASDDDKTRVEARHSLVAMGKTAVPSLIEALESKRYLMRWEAAKALSEIGDSGAASALVKALEDEEFDVRWIAAEGLIKMNIHGLKPLLQALKEEADSSFLREGAHHVLHDLAKGALRESLTPALNALESMEPLEEVPLAVLKTLEMLKAKKKL
jgi:HEAT repeat protein